MHEPPAVSPRHRIRPETRQSRIERGGSTTIGNLVGILALLATVAPAAALTPGGGSKTTDCLAEFGGTPANAPASRPTQIRCVDNDPACDDDPTPGTCGFRVEICLNVTDPDLPACTPRALDGFVVENEHPDTNPLHDFDRQALQDQLAFFALPIDAVDLDFCTGEVAMHVPLRLRITGSGARWSTGRKVIETEVTGPGNASDADKYRLTCVKDRSLDPCAGITSTFEQIQAHVFEARSCGRSTCHNAIQPPHDLSLAPADALASLVGATPTNTAAALAGKKRVDPGNPANSFLLDKLRGTLQAGEGVRMPYELRPLSATDIRLVEDWILAGAPAMGFVSSVGCH